MYNIATPILSNKNIGATYESKANCKIIKHNATAIITYIITSELDKSLVSKTVADIPLILQRSSVMSLNFSIVSIVVSDEMLSLKVTSKIVFPSLYTLSFISFGIISTGMLVPRASEIPTTFSTLSISLNLSSSFKISFVFIFSNTTIEYAPILKSSERIFSPLIVSMLSGKYTKIS